VDVVDDGLSRNGHRGLNGQRIQGRQRLRDADVLQIGRTVPGDARPRRRGLQADGRRGRRGVIPELTPAQRRVLEALCRPYKESEFATPATNQQIAEELFLSVDAVKAHLRALFGAFGVEDLPQNQKRSVLAMRALQLGVVR
jgi:DNA-binding NarL/FixJ family response regulator